MSRIIKFSEAILEGQDICLDRDPNVYLTGLGVPDPKGIFGTTLGLQEKYGAERVFDMPTSENSMTGIAIGSAIMGLRPIMTHQRVDFFLLALDQLINNASKWHYMFGGQMNVPMVIRLIIGRGWGQGPQHSQSLHALFGHIPGLKVIAPATPYDAKGLLIGAVEDNNPVVYLEHRWLHNTVGEVPKNYYRIDMGKARVIREGRDLTIVTLSHMTIEALKAYPHLLERGINAEIIDLRTITPLDRPTIYESVKKTGKLLVVDGDWKTMGLSAEIMASVVEDMLPDLKEPPIRITFPDCPAPTSWYLANHFYPQTEDIISAASKLCHKTVNSSLQEMLKKKMLNPLDVPDKAFTGPF